MHLVAVGVLTGVGWVVQAVVYPAFALVGDAQWPAYHRRHRWAIALVVFPPWSVQGVSVVVLAVSGISAPVVALGVLALMTVVVTGVWAVPAHDRLVTRRDRADLRSLLRANLTRTLAWTASTVVAALLLAGG